MIVAQAISRALAAEGVRMTAGITGQSIGFLADALVEQPGVRMFYVRQERVAVDICDGYARVTGTPGVAFTDAGPAAANLMGGLVNSWGDSVPVLVFAGHNDRFEVPRRQSKEIPLLELFRPVSRWAAIIEDPSQVEPVIRRAFVHLRTRPSGPVVIGLPYDVSRMQAGKFEYSPLSSRPAARSAADPVSVAAAVDLLAGAAHPYLYAGAGVIASGAAAELREFAELLTLPVATTLNGKGAFPERHALALGLGGFGRALYSSLPAVNVAAAADAVMSVGCGFKRQATVGSMPGGAKHVQVEVDPAELHKEQVADLGLLGDAKLVLRQMIEAAKSRLAKQRLAPVQSRLAELAALRKRWEAFSETLVSSGETPINPFRVTGELSRLVNPDEAILLHDAGSVRGTTCQHYLVNRPGSFLGFGVQSAMGWSIGAAIGAKAAAPGKLVMTCIGEEAFGETAMDLETSVRAGAPILVVVKNNSAFPDNDGGISPKLGTLRFAGGVKPASVAAALGAKSYRVSDPSELAGTLAAAKRDVEGGTTAVVEVLTCRVPGNLFPRWTAQQA